MYQTAKLLHAIYTNILNYDGFCLFIPTVQESLLFKYK